MIDESARTGGAFASGLRAEKADAAVVVVNYNHDELLYRCVSSIARSESLPVETIIVDNASDTVPYEVANEPKACARIIDNRRNVGFARAVNQAIIETNTKYVLMLNPDTMVKPDAIGKMVEFMDKHPGVGIAGCKLLHPDGTLQWSCRTFYTPITILFRRSPLGKLWPNNPISRKHLMADWDHKSARSVDWILGACMIVRREAIKDVGMLDEGFFLYFEDVDWCYRMQQHGWKVYYFPGAEVVHHHMRSSAKMNRTALYHISSMLYYYRKHFLSNLLPDLRSVDRRTRVLQRVLKIRRIPLWRKAAVSVSCRVSRILTQMARFAHGRSRGRAPDLLAVRAGTERDGETTVVVAGRRDPKR